VGHLVGKNGIGNMVPLRPRREIFDAKNQLIFCGLCLKFFLNQKKKISLIVGNNAYVCIKLLHVACNEHNEKQGGLFHIYHTTLWLLLLSLKSELASFK
jgi:hypothetical protein